MNTKRVFSALLALCLVFALIVGLCVPLYAAATGTDENEGETSGETSGEETEGTEGETTEGETTEGETTEDEPADEPDLEHPMEFQGGDPECNGGEHEADSQCDEVCNICGAVRVGSGGHIYRKDCSTECKQCGQLREPKAEHTYKADKFCGATCTVCGEVNVEGHNFGEWETYDKRHEGKCQDCGQKVAEAHDFQNACDPDCSICGYVREPKHYYDNPCDDTCNIKACSHVREVKPHVFLEKNDVEYHWKECRMCGLVEEKGEHTYSDVWNNREVTWSVNEAYHWHVCISEICGRKDCMDAANHYSDTSRHVYDDDMDTDCNECGYVRNVAAPGQLLGYVGIGVAAGVVVLAVIWLLCMPKKKKAEAKN